MTEPQRTQSRANNQTTKNPTQNLATKDDLPTPIAATRAERRRIERQQKKTNKARNGRASTS